MGSIVQSTEVISRHPEIQLGIVSGSVARGEEGVESDLDIAVEARKLLTAEARKRLVEELAVATGRSIDLVDPKRQQKWTPIFGQVR